MATIGKEFVAAIVTGEDIESFLRVGNIDHLFKENERTIYNYVKEHIHKHGAIPKLETVENDTGEELPGADEPPTYYLEKMTNRHIEAVLKTTNAAVRDLLKPRSKDPQAALSVMSEAIFEISMKQKSAQMVDFRDAYDMIWGRYIAQNIAEDGEFGLSFGWPALDALSGGGQAGDLISFVGRPKRGKTFMLLYVALHIWKTYKKPILFFSMEMTPRLIIERLAAMETHVKLTGIKKAFLSTHEQKKLKKGLANLSETEVPFHIVDGNLTSTVEEIYAMSRQLNPAAIFVDGAYLLGHQNKSLNRFARVAENVSLLKQDVASALHVPVYTTWQFGRPKDKGKKGHKFTLDDIGLTDTVGQLSSIVVGLLEDESVETMKRRKLDILAGRGGEDGDFDINWDFDSMDFSEVSKNAGPLKYI